MNLSFLCHGGWGWVDDPAETRGNVDIHRLPHRPEELIRQDSGAATNHPVNPVHPVRPFSFSPNRLKAELRTKESRAGSMHPAANVWKTCHSVGSSSRPYLTLVCHGSWEEPISNELDMYWDHELFHTPHPPYRAPSPGGEGRGGGEVHGKRPVPFGTAQ